MAYCKAICMMSSAGTAELLFAGGLFSGGYNIHIKFGNMTNTKAAAPNKEKVKNMNFRRKVFIMFILKVYH